MKALIVVLLALFVAIATAAEVEQCSASLSCAECHASDLCGFCSVTDTLHKCGNLTVPDGAINITTFCEDANGTLIAHLQCPAPTVPPAPVCGSALPCGECQAKAECGYCQLEGYGKCLPKTGELNLEFFCHNRSGHVVTQGMCPLPPAPKPPHCDWGTNCSACVASEAGCGYCSYNEGLSAKCGTMANNFTGLCADKGGVLYTRETGQCPAPPMCSSYGCKECREDDRCGFCLSVDRTTGKVLTACRPKTVPETVAIRGFPNITTYCTSAKGILAGITCPILPSIFECVPKNCNQCLQDPNCDFCSGTFSGVEWGVCKPKGIASDICTHEGGSLFNNIETCPVHVHEPVVGDDHITEKINDGDLTESQVNTDVNKDSQLEDFVVVVTVITEAKHEGQGKSNFKTFVDVTGDRDPTEPEKGKVCDALKRSLSKNLEIKTEGIECGLTFKSVATKKRVINSYVADVTVDSTQTLGAGSVVVSVALLVASVTAVLF